MADTKRFSGRTLWILVLIAAIVLLSIIPSIRGIFEAGQRAAS